MSDQIRVELTCHCGQLLIQTALGKGGGKMRRCPQCGREGFVGVLAVDGGYLRAYKQLSPQPGEAMVTFESARR